MSSSTGKRARAGQDTPKVCVLSRPASPLRPYGTWRDIVPSCPAVPHCIPLCPAALFGQRICQAGSVIMPRRPAQITQADVARIIRAAKQAGASEVIVKIGEQSVIVKLSTSQTKALEPDAEIVL
jgi:hypothetical protein